MLRGQRGTQTRALVCSSSTRFSSGVYENLPNELLLTTPPTDPDYDSKASLLSGGVTLLAIQVINRVAMLALAVLLARGLGANDYGVYAFAFAVVGLVSVFAEFGFPTLLERLVASADSKQDQPLLAGLQRRSSQLVAGTSLLAAAGLVGTATTIATIGGN